MYPKNSDQPKPSPAPWRPILDFWFPEGQNLDIDASTHQQHWQWRMHGGADRQIINLYSLLTTQAANGELDAWASEPDGRLALIILLDQFSRSVWRDNTKAYAQDPKALALALEGLGNGHYAALNTPWERVVFGLPLGHCEGPGHAERLDTLIALRTQIAREAPAHLQAIYQQLVKQAGLVKEVITVFGRHPHRNALLGRASTPAEERYINEGVFPHRQAFKSAPEVPE